jgi:hypothetical protein
MPAKKGEAKNNIVVDKKSKCEQTLMSERKTLEAELAVRKRKVEAMENEIAALRGTSVGLEEQMMACERKSFKWTEIKNKYTEENLARYKHAVDEMKSARQLMAEHDAYFRQRDNRVAIAWQLATEKIDNMVDPTINMSDDRNSGTNIRLVLLLP